MNQLSQLSYRGVFITIQEGDISTIQLRYGPNDVDCVSLVEIPSNYSGISTARVEVSVNDSSLNAVKTKALINALQVALQLLPDFNLIIRIKERYFNVAA
jgi:hypothetical protein